jgi:hypothetical protein
MKNTPITKSAVTAVFSLLLITSAAFANQPNGCAQLGQPPLGPTPPYDYTANGVPSLDNCWYKTNVTYTTGYDSCNYWRNYWDLGANSELSQTLVVPSDHHFTSLKLYYILDFIDPHLDGSSNTFRSDVYDLTTSAWLGGDYWSGWNGSLSCAQRIITCSSSADLAGHTLEIKFSATKGYSNTDINVKLVSLLNNGS